MKPQTTSVMWRGTWEFCALMWFHMKWNFENLIYECRKWCCSVFVFALFRVAVWRCVQCVGDNMGSQTHSFKPLCPFYCLGTGWVLQRHHPQQQHGLYWHYKILQWFVPYFKPVTVFFINAFSTIKWALHLNIWLLGLSFYLQEWTIMKTSW